jgi:hypothetical protein
MWRAIPLRDAAVRGCGVLPAATVVERSAVFRERGPRRRRRRAAALAGAGDRGRSRRRETSSRGVVGHCGEAVVLWAGVGWGGSCGGDGLRELIFYVPECVVW